MKVLVHMILILETDELYTRFRFFLHYSEINLQRFGVTVHSGTHELET